MIIYLTNWYLVLLWGLYLAWVVYFIGTYPTSRGKSGRQKLSYVPRSGTRAKTLKTSKHEFGKWKFYHENKVGQ
jgi:hypothetical protein